MPISPAHIGPPIFIGAIAGKRLNIYVLILSGLLIDIEVVWLGTRGPMSGWLLISHGFLHTFIGATLFAIIFAVIFFLLLISYRKIIDHWYGNIDVLKELRGMFRRSGNIPLAILISQRIILIKYPVIFKKSVFFIEMGNITFWNQ